MKTALRLARSTVPFIGLALVSAALSGCGGNADPGMTQAMLKAMHEAPAVMAEAEGRTSSALLDDLARRHPAEEARAASPAEIDLIQRRAGVPLPTEFRELLADPRSRRALDWVEPEAMVRARDLEPGALAAAFHRRSDAWAESTVVVEPLDGWWPKWIPARDLERYLVLERSVLGTLVLYDPGEPPLHPCCRVIDTSLIEGDPATGLGSLRRLLERAWAGHKLGHHFTAMFDGPREDELPPCPDDAQDIDDIDIDTIGVCTP